MSEAGARLISTGGYFPAVRADVSYFRDESGGGIAFYDVQRFVPESFLLHEEAGNLLALFNGRTRRGDLAVAADEMKAGLAQFEALLDTNHVLDSPAFRRWQAQFEQEWEAGLVRHPVCAGPVYPAEAAACRMFLDAAFSRALGAPVRPARMIFAPHIDYRVGLGAYVDAFACLAATRPKRVVLLGTSHYAGMYGRLYEHQPIIATRKSFFTPLGTMKTDVETVHAFAAAVPEAVSLNDRAHRIEHSLELHALLLAYLCPQAEIVPLLVGSLEEVLYVPEGAQGAKTAAAASWLGERFGGDRETVFCVSGDLAHVGRKFGDRKPASRMLDDVKAFDRLFLEAAVSGVSGRLLSVMQSNEDAFRICGFPPLYVALRAFSAGNGESVAYQCWEETDMESAVTFGAAVWK